jgi:hypothetical protein
MVLGRRETVDPLARQAALALAAGRLAVGTGALLVTRPALRTVGFPEPGATGWSLAKVLGARDVAIGALIIAARDDRATLRAATLAVTTLDAADLLAFSLAAGDPETRRAGAVGAAMAAVAVVGGLWACRRLGPA